MENVENKKSKKYILGEIFRFLLIGGFATIVDYIVFFLFNSVILKEIHETANLFISTFLGFVAGLIINWVFSARFVYRYGKKTTKKQLLIYIAICVAGLALTEIGMHLAKPLFETYLWNINIFSLHLEIDFWKWFFKVLMTIIVLVLNYLGRKFLIFKD